MLTISLLIFTVVAVLGLMNAGNLLGGKPRAGGLATLHGALALIGSALVIYAGLAGLADGKPVFINIMMAVVIIILGVTISLRRMRGRAPGTSLVLGHAGLAVVCYLILAAFVFNFV